MSPSAGLHVAADVESKGPVKPFWGQVVGAGRAAEGLRADWQRHLKLAAAACGFKYVRFHGIFHDDMHVYHEVDGKVVYNFQYIDALFDALLDMKVRPFVEFGFCPSSLASIVGTVFWWRGSGSPPKDFGKWGNLVRASVQHWVNRYGHDEVVQWYFECWNEPNLNVFWRGTRSQYYALYETTARAVKSVNTALRIGGPATSNFVPDSRFDGDVEDMEIQKALATADDIDSMNWRPVWVEHFLQWCHSRDIPVDFVSCHPYPTDWALDTTGQSSRRVRSIDATPKDMALVREVVSRSPYPQAEIHLTEWSSSPSSRDHAHDNVPVAIYIVRTMLASIGLVDTIAYWTFTDIFEEEGAGLTPFHGGFGIINYQGFPKPTFHAFRLLSWLGDELLQYSPDDGVVTRDKKSNLVSAILYHYPPEMRTSPPPAYEDQRVVDGSFKIGVPARKSITIENLDPGTTFQFQILSPGHRGDVVSAWKRLGSPATFNKSVTQQLDDYSSTLNLRILTANSEGRLIFEEELVPWTMIAIAQIKR